MREEDSSNNWFSKWEDELPSPEDLMPLTQSLITPDLALAFNIPNHHSPPPPPPPPPPNLPSLNHHHHHQQPQSSNPNSSTEFDSPDLTNGSDEHARTLKRPRLVWTPQLHKRFVDAVAHLGIKNAVPKTIMQLMSVDGLTRENVASHLQKYRLYLKRMQGGGGNNSGSNAGMDSATDRLFASSPVPAHFLHQGRANSEHFLPFVPNAMQHHHHQMVSSAPVQHLPPQFRHFGNSPPNGQFEHPFVRQNQNQVQRIGTPSVYSGNGSMAPPAYVEDLEPSNNGRKILTLFPTE